MSSYETPINNNKYSYLKPNVTHTSTVSESPSTLPSVELIKRVEAMPHPEVSCLAATGLLMPDLDTYPNSCIIIKKFIYYFILESVSNLKG
jgi:hypothetical protein